MSLSYQYLPLLFLYQKQLERMPLINRQTRFCAFTKPISSTPTRVRSVTSYLDSVYREERQPSLYFTLATFRAKLDRIFFQCMCAYIAYKPPQGYRQ